MNYFPIQITNVGRMRETSGYSELTPSAALKEFVMCYWFFKTTDSTRDIIVNPDCCADIIFNLNARNIADFSEITGTFSDMFYIPGSGLNACGIRLKPGATYHLIREGIDTLSNTAVSSVNYPQINCEFIADNIINKSNQEIKIFFDSYFSNIFRKIEIRESKFIYSLNIFNSLADYGEKDLLVSDKTLDRYFIKYFGLTRKKISSVLRFQNSLKQIINYGNILPEGYYDQPHFIKDFKRYAGMTPGDFLKNI
ncbi:MAG: helix-turn-helix transcriptional regulator [Spirochaetes bacterium]|nr:helix-turn-helix transcriptional regulator [Spirochaetota bacterium]MBP9021820.1 helix-turn-helix transcriptional regulator [Spirochaetota bacterium]